MKIINLIEDTAGTAGCHYEHGLSFYIESEGHRLLLDAGASGNFIKNAGLLGIDLLKIDTVVISHGHYDHTGGLLDFAKINKNAKIYIQKSADGEFFNCRGGGKKYIGMNRGIAKLPQVVFIDGDLKIDEELSIFSGITARRLWPRGNEILRRLEGEEYLQDDFSHEQYLAITEGDRRVLLSGCAHNGILNILERYRELYGINPTDVISGFHTMRQEYDEESLLLIRDTALALRDMNTRFYSGHCTGDVPLEIMKQIMGDKLTALHSGERII